MRDQGMETEEDTKTIEEEEIEEEEIDKIWIHI